ncbi:MAG: acetyl-CoA carboxylase biotin carboxyl carrier protein [Deltaproteobacteria bacterium]|nr:acetyl-CoA carboxylase biotin carboxyl carrier protein [Deltaproteobacteria bacterium]
MEIDDIKKLMELMEEKGVVELEIKNAAGEVRLVRAHHQVVAAPLPVASMAAPPTMTLPPPPPLANPLPQSSEQPALDPTLARGVAIPSPMVGTFYRTPTPDAKPYVEVGSVVEIGDVVCIVEAMKMMNEIQSEVRGRVLRVMIENGKAVEYGQPLFLLEPL